MKKKDYFQKFHIELLTSNERNRDAIISFSATEEGKPLEGYLKNKAWEADTEGETKVYLVKDIRGSIALFFSIKCGLLYKRHLYDDLDEEKREFVNMLIDAKLNDDQDTLTSYYSSGMYSDFERNQLFEIAGKRIELKMEEKEIHVGKYALKVDECFSAIEIQHLCKNNAYKLMDEIDIPLGFGIFWEVIVPFVYQITNKVGCKYLYLFAADYTSDQEVKKLIQYYKSELKFCDIENMMILKPWYDKDCLGLMQEISKLQYNRNAVWEEFSDVNNEV